VSAHHFLPFHCVADQVERTKPTCFRLRAIAKTVSYDPAHFLSPSDRTALAGAIREGSLAQARQPRCFVLDYLDMPLAENTRRNVGLRFADLMAALRVLLSAPNWAALTVCEVNPDHGEADGSTLRTFIGALADALACSPRLG
jgi:hypothetical protein